MIFSFLKGWLTLKDFKPFEKPENEAEKKILFSIIIAARNEDKNIKNLLNDLIFQKFNNENYEVLVVNDHSTDETNDFVEEIIKFADNIKLIQLDKDNQGKKAAINKGIRLANGDLIITTDADCRLQKDWLFTIEQFYSKYRPKMIVAPVLLRGNSLFQEIQQLEFISLIASTAGAIGINQPIMCNGANLIFEKQCFINFQDALNEKYQSGDDLFLMQKIKKSFPNQIAFLKSKSAVVLTPGSSSIIEFINQRIRWASKSKGYTLPAILIVSILVLSFNLAILLVFILSAGNFAAWKHYLALILIKSIPDFLTLYTVTKYFKKAFLLKWFIPLQLIYPFYIVFIASMAQILSFNWKGRVIKY